MSLKLNLGGEGEEPEAINQQPEWRDLSDNVSRSGEQLRDLLLNGVAFLFCSNHALPFPDGSVDEVVTNSVPIDRTTPWGPGIQSSEIWRFLRPDGQWLDNGTRIIRPA